MSQSFEFFFDIVSPYSYLAAIQVSRDPAFQQAVWRPFYLGAVMKAAGNQPPAVVPAKGRYMYKDLQRLATFYDLPFTFPSVFPANTLIAMRALAAAQPHDVQRYALDLFQAYWGEGRDVSSPEVLTSVLPAELVEAAATDAVKEILKANTDDAIARGAFGAPTFFVGNDMYFGEDRLFLIEAALRANAS